MDDCLKRSDLQDKGSHQCVSVGDGGVDNTSRKKCRRDELQWDGTGSDGPVLGSWSAGDEEVKEVVKQSRQEEQEQENCATEFPIFLLTHLL